MEEREQGNKAKSTRQPLKSDSRVLSTKMRLGRSVSNLEGLAGIFLTPINELIVDSNQKFLHKNNGKYLF